MRARPGVIGSIGLLLLAACSSDEPARRHVDVPGALIALVRWEVAQQTPVPDTLDDELPVVYIVSSDGETYSPSDQAEVAKATVDEATVRFADARADALDLEDETEPVKEAGVLLVVSPIDTDGGARIEVPVNRYRNVDEQRDWILTVTARSGGTSVTGSSLPPA